MNALFITITGRKIKKIDSDTIENVFYTFFGTAIYYLLISIITKELFTIKYEYLNYGFMLAIFSTFIPLTLNFFSLKKLESHSLAIIMPLEIVFASLLSFLIFGEMFNIIKVLGFIFVGIAPIIENIMNIKGEKDA
ncbi:EamA family transporter [Thermosipho africanus]|uniref:EamA family transporter n=1 Tax=Thermosipho africanus TaxID=2421 RepID=UPI0002DA3294|nr:DMT family transporter [Thermosipho africanus]